mgnify:CR=1 FL=1
MQKAIRLAVGVVFILVGIAGLILPIIPGTIFILLGLLAFSTVYEPVGKLFRVLESRYPHLHKHLERWRKRLFPDAP